MNIGLYLRDNTSKKPQRIWAIFRTEGGKYKINTGKKIQPQFWSTKKQMILSGYKNSKKLNDFLVEYKMQLENVVLDFQVKKNRLTSEKIQEEIDKIFKSDIKSINEPDFIHFIKTVIKSKADLSKGTKTSLTQCKNNIIKAFSLVSRKTLLEYESMTRKQKSESELLPEKRLDFEDINLEMIIKFKEYLLEATYTIERNQKKVELRYKKNYVAKQIKQCKQFIELAISQGLVKPFKTSDVKANEEDVDTVYTNFEEIQTLINLDLRNDIKQEKVRDAYIINCFLGFRYSDFKSIRPHNFHQIILNNKKEIVYKGRSRKTDAQIEFVVHPTALELLEKYEFDPPKIIEQEYNELLKTICEKAGLTRLERIRETRGGSKIFLDIPKYKLMSSHAGRRSFCTNFFIQGIATRAIMAVSGHKTEREFLKYINKTATVDIGTIALQVNNIKLSVFSKNNLVLAPDTLMIQ